MALPATDTFTASSNAALQTYSSNWTISAGGLAVDATADAAYASAGDVESGAFWNADTFSNDQYAQGVLNVADVLGAIGVAVRCSAGGNYYGLYYQPPGQHCWLFKMVGGVWTELGYAQNVGNWNGATLRLEVSGTTLTPKLNGSVITAIGAKTDSSLTSGRAGICGYGNKIACLLDNWEGGNLGSSGSNGSANITLGAATVTAAGSVGVNGALSKTLGAATLSASGSVGTATINGSANITLGAATLSAAGSVSVNGALSKTLGAATVSAAGSVQVRGAASITLGAATLSARGFVLTGATVGGVLVQSASNGRYFENDSGPVVLAGPTTWYEFQDGGLSYPPTAFDYEGWLDYLGARGANLHKMWVMETARQWADADAYFYPMPYQRTGPGNAADGRPKFDLTLFNQEYFDRLRERVILAGNRGHYVVVQLFQGWQVESKGFGFTPFAYHPYNNGNNVNGIDGDTDNDGAGEETRSTAFTAVYNLQKAYVEKVIDTLNDLDNVLWEISNEDTTNSVAWQHALIDYIHTYEAGKAKQHPVGMTVIWPGGSDSDLTSSNADWISPNNGNSLTPGTAGGTQVVLFDTDHIVGLTTEHEWIWQSFTRGFNPVFMDVYDGALYGADQRADSAHERIRNNLGAVLDWAAQLDLANATPQNSLASTGYCLAKTTGQYQLVAYQPTSGAFTVNLSGLTGTFALTWLRTAATTPNTQSGGTVAGNGTRTLTPPWSGEDAAALLELWGTDGAAAITLGAAIVTATGSVSVNGAAAITLSAATLTATGSVQVQGQAALTLGAVTVTAAGSVTVQGAAAIALGAVTVSAAGAVDVTGAADVTLGAATLSAIGSVTVNGAADVTLGAVTLAAEGVAGAAPVTGTAAVTLGAATLAASGSVFVNGGAALALDAATLAATGSVEVAGALAVTLDAATVTAAGSVAVNGAAAVTLGAATLAAAGIVGNVPVTGEAAITLGAATLAATGVIEVTGTAALTLGAAALAATGSVEVNGSATITLGAATVVGVGTTVVAVAVVLGSIRGPGAAGSTAGPRASGTIGRYR